MPDRTVIAEIAVSLIPARNDDAAGQIRSRHLTRSSTWLLRSPSLMIISFLSSILYFPTDEGTINDC
jgi:hypothetical protein